MDHDNSLSGFWLLSVLVVLRVYNSKFSQMITDPSPDQLLRNRCTRYSLEYYLFSWQRAFSGDCLTRIHSPSVIPDSGYLSCAQPPSDVTCTSGLYCICSQIITYTEFLKTFIIISHAVLFTKILRNFCFSQRRWLCLFNWYSELWNLCDRMWTPGKLIVISNADQLQQISKTLRHGFLD